MKKTTTPKQFEVLVGYLQKHSDLAVGFANSSEAKVRRRQMWIRLTDKLNHHGPPVRNCMEWKSIWSDYKYNLKRKLAADIKLARRKNCNKRLPFNRIEQAVINLLGFKDKLVNFNKYHRRNIESLLESTEDPLTENSSPVQYNEEESDMEIDEDKRGVIINVDFDSKISAAVINNSVEPIPIEEEYLETTDNEVNVSGVLKDTLISMQRTQQAILNELMESNRQKKNMNELKEQLIQIEQEKLNEQKQQNYEVNKQAYINIELKRKELELYELKIKGLCTQCTLKKEID